MVAESTRNRRRQWGSERRSEPLSIVHPRPSGRAITLGRLGLIATVAFWLVYVITTIFRELVNNPGEGFRFTVEAISYLIVVTILTFSAFMYLLARQGALYRFRDHVRVPRGELDRHFAEYSDGITVLVPSYAEETNVVRATLWSAALQEFPELSVVLLLDDPPFPSDPAVLARLEETRALAAQIEDALRQPSERFTSSVDTLASKLAADPTVHPSDVSRLADDYEAAAEWLEAMADTEQVSDHVDEFFVDQVVMGLARELRLTLLALRAAVDQGDHPDADRVMTLALRLARIFTTKLGYFERKKFASLSHEANKAMNLNSYIGLMGGAWSTQQTADGVVLRPAADEASADLIVPDTTYLLTLDADSLLLRDYCVRLVYLLEQPENARVAVTQTPYSAFRGAPTRIERVAGATTDLQHVLHQGMTYYNATFWVGANAVIRKRAIEDIVEVEVVAGFPVKTYIQDRTVIEDTESSIDLGEHGWTLVNYPERLSYSATPPDFGSLVVQRRRWANGGLLILPKFFRQMKARKRAGVPVRLTEVMLRVNYMASIAWASFGLVFLLAYPYDSRLLSPLVLLAALPYFIAQASDLKACGYKYSDILRIYGFNLILLPVNLAGVLKSIEQSLTGKKIPFARTPKVRNRTATQLLYVVAPYGIVAFSVLTAWRNVLDENWGNAAFAAFNAFTASWAILGNIGVVNSLADIWLGLTDWMWVDKKRRDDDHDQSTGGEFDWQTALYHGHAPAGAQSGSRAVTRRNARPARPAASALGASASTAVASIAAATVTPAAGTERPETGPRHAENEKHPA